MAACTVSGEQRKRLCSRPPSIYSATVRSLTECVEEFKLKLQHGIAVSVEHVISCVHAEWLW